MALREFLMLRKLREQLSRRTQGAGPVICLTRSSARMPKPQLDDRGDILINLGVVGTEFDRREASDFLDLDPLEAEIGVAVQRAEPSADGFAGL